MGSVVRAFFISISLVGLMVAALFLFKGNGAAMGYMGLEVVNDTNKPVRVQPCWDLACFDTVGLHESVLQPGARKRVHGTWPNVTPQEIVVGVMKLHAEPMHFTGCMLRYFQPGATMGLMHVSKLYPCPTSDPGGGG